MFVVFVHDKVAHMVEGVWGGQGELTDAESTLDGGVHGERTGRGGGGTENGGGAVSVEPLEDRTVCVVLVLGEKGLEQNAVVLLLNRGRGRWSGQVVGAGGSFAYIG